MKPKPKPARKSNAALLASIRKKLAGLDLRGHQHLQDRLALLRSFETEILEKRILATIGSRTSRTQIAIDARLGGPQAAQLERKMLVRVLGILHNAPTNGGPS